MARTGRDDRTYRAKRDALRRQAKRNNTPCHLCGKPIDFTLDWKHPMAFTADHLEAIAAGGRMLGDLAPAHRSCNSRRGKKPLGTTKRASPPKTSRQW